MKKLFLLMTVLAASCALALGQVRTVRGVVKSAEDGAPLPQLTVLLKGTTTGVVTNLDGEYTIKVPSDAAVLLFKYTGYETQEITVNGQSVINVNMRPALEEIDQVVVTGYGTIKKQSMVGAQSSVGEKELARRPVSNVSAALSGSAPGVQVTTASGQPGEESDIRIRGFGSVNASSAPLYVVDGSVFNGKLSDIAPQDVQSISILKDAASTAIYGSSAGNGVILITTKSGSRQEGSGSFTFTTSHGVSMRGMPFYDRVTIKEYFPLRWQQWYNENLYGNGLSPEVSGLYANMDMLSVYGYQPFTGDLGYVVTNPDGSNPRTSATQEAGMINFPQVVMADGTLNPKVSGLKWGDDLDWASYMFQPGYRQEYNLSGGYTAKKFRSYMSVGYINEKGYKVHTGLTRYNVRVNANYDVNKYFTTGASVAYARSFIYSPKNASSGYSSNPFNFAQYVGPMYPVHLHNTETGEYILKNGKKQYDHSPTRPYSAGFNPIEEGELDSRVSTINSIQSRVYGEVHIMPYLNFKVNGAYDVFQRFTKVRYNNSMGDQPIGMLRMIPFQNQTFTLNELLEYKQAFGKHEISALLGHENYLYQSMNMTAEKKNAAVNGVDQFANYSEMSNITSIETNYRKEGYFGRVNYDYSNLYNASVSYRRDGSSRFAPNKRWGNFWSLGAGWHIGNEKFMESTRNWLSELKLRFSIGQTGNDQLNDFYPWQTTYSFGQNNLNAPGLRFSNLGNANLVWESQTSYDLAIDFGLFHRVNATVEFFIKESANLLFDYALPTSTGIGSQSRNIGKVRNYGIEFNIDADVIRTSDWRWNVSLNGTWFRNVLVQLPEANRKDGIVNGSHKYMEGYSIYEWYLPQFEGVDPADGQAMFLLDTEKYPSNLFGVEKTGERAKLTKDHTKALRVIKGNSIPDLYGGFSTSLSWRGIELSMLVNYQIGGLAYDGGYQELMGRALNTGRAAHVDLKKAWRKPGDKTDVPRLDNGTEGQYINASSNHWLTDASSLMLKNVSLSYTLPQNWLKPLQVVKSARIGVTGENLLLLTRRKGFNPLGGFSGSVDGDSFVFARTITATLSVTF